MTNIIIGAILGIVACFLCMCIYGIIEDRRLGEDYEMVIMPKSKLDIINKNNITICLHDDEYTGVHFDDDKKIKSFMTCHPNNIKSADFYYSLFKNKEIITIDYELQIYKAVLTQIIVINEDTLKIYYTVIKSYDIEHELDKIEQKYR